MFIETLEQLNEIVSSRLTNGSNCILCIEDNKSNITVQSVIVKHPLDFIRNLNDFSKNLRLPVSDMDICLIGFIGEDYTLTQLSDIAIISPYVYFKKADVPVDSASNSTVVE